MNRWQNVNAIYQIYPRSFYDANGDGVGDIRGIIQKLDYLKGDENGLGVDAIWLSPVYTSPMADYGYDVADYRDIDPDFGTLDDMKELIAKAHERGMKVMMDIVPNHTSNQHEWFKKSRESRDNPYRNYYIWRDPKEDGSAPNNWRSQFFGGAWEFDDTTGQYYLHNFMKEQPDLNWENPKVREEMNDILRFWMELGVDGFRADAVWALSKDMEFRDEPDGGHMRTQYGPKLQSYLREMAEVVAEYEDRIIIFENYTDNPAADNRDHYRELYDVYPGVAYPFNFDGMRTAWGAASFKEHVTRFHEWLNEGERLVYCLSNHDQPRMVSRFGELQARLLGMFQLTLPGLPTFYNGDEIGMPNGTVQPGQGRDVGSLDNPMNGRDPERTPLQWNNEAHAGFTSGTPWLPVGDSYHDINVAKQQANDNSFLRLYHQLLKLRSDYAAFRTGNMIILGSTADIFAYECTDVDSAFIILLNFGDYEQEVFATYDGKVVCGTQPEYLPQIAPDGHVRLHAFEGIVVKIR